MKFQEKESTFGPKISRRADRLSNLSAECLYREKAKLNAFLALFERSLKMYDFGHFYN